jgi:hypothetical protein
MHRSSESVAALASALAKAQSELVNPEKSLTGTIWRDRRPAIARKCDQLGTGSSCSQE